MGKNEFKILLAGETFCFPKTPFWKWTPVFRQRTARGDLERHRSIIFRKNVSILSDEFEFVNEDILNYSPFRDSVELGLYGP